MHSNAMSQTRGMSRRTVLSIALLVGLTWSACLCSAAEPDRNQNELHVMSFNIRYGTADDGPDRWENRRQQVCEVIERNQCDVIGLQEALRFQIDAIREALGCRCVREIGVGREDGKTKGEYFRHSLSHRPPPGGRRPERSGVRHARGSRLDDVGATGSHASAPGARFIHKPSGKAFYHFNTTSTTNHSLRAPKERGAAGPAHRTASTPTP